MEYYKRATLESYQKNSGFFARYFENNSNLDNNGKKGFEKFISLLNGKNILDVGCGSGDCLLWFKNECFNIIAIDLSPAMVKISKSKKVNAQVMDMENMTFSNSSFNGIWTDKPNNTTFLNFLLKKKILDKIY